MLGTNVHISGGVGTWLWAGWPIGWVAARRRRAGRARLRST